MLTGMSDSCFFSLHEYNSKILSFRAKEVLGYSATELADQGCYDLVHYDDLAYVASAHQERK